MRLLILSCCLLPLVGILIEAAPTSTDPQQAASQQIAEWQKKYEQYIKGTIETRYSGCTSQNIVYRREWSTLSYEDREDYIKAVKCLRKKPALTTRSYAPGARSRFDDWQATHILLAANIHFSGLFFHWHRFYTWLYEKALRDECGYKGTQPYWDWTIGWQDPRKSPVFDGSPYSMGSNGKSVPHGNAAISAFGRNSSLPPATGGGCIESGPFANTTVNLGPVAIQPPGPDNGLGYNPRCLPRDISLVGGNMTRPTDLVHALSSCTDLSCFDNVIEQAPGFHFSGHFTVGSLMADPYASPGDPVFYLHHASIDRVWAMWQSLSPGNRTNQVYGTSTAFNRPPSADVTLDTEVDFGALSPNQTLGDLTSTVDGPFCYMYV